jgi:hypothetical protein
MLVMLGNIIGRTAHFIVESKKHFLNEFVLLVGDTSKSRKGTSYEYAEQLFLPCDPLWTRVSGLSSGEGLIWSVRDPIVSSGKKGQVTTDPGITDKRLLVFESELASTLHVMERSGNTLGDVMKNAWDGRALGTMTKHEPARATGAHVSVVAHITNAELHRYLTRTEIANGWANRFLVLCVKRARLLPLGGQQVALGAFQAELAHVVRVAKATSVMPFEAEAERHWCAKYEWLSVDRPGLLGSMAARAEAHTRRLACLYALSDGCQEVRLPHLEAALECWRYAFDSLAYVFGDALGDTEADTILRALRQAPDGLTRTELHKLFGSHLSTTDLDRALGLLVRLHLIVKVEADREGTGRPAERWRAVRQDC